jgi:hypothetical protein
MKRPCSELHGRKRLLTINALNEVRIAYCITSLSLSGGSANELKGFIYAIVTENVAISEKGGICSFL